MRRSVLFFAFLLLCDRELTAVSDSKLSVRQDRGSTVLNITNIGASGVTTAALYRESYNRTELAPECIAFPSFDGIRAHRRSRTVRVAADRQLGIGTVSAAGSRST